MPIARRLAPVALTALLAAGCASSSGGTPVWSGAAPHTSEPNGVTIVPAAPGDPNSGGTTEPRPQQGGSPTPSTPRKAGQDPAVLATRLAAPIGLVLMPDGTALVGERTTGRIVRVQPRPGQPVPTVKTLTGLDAAGDGGLLDLAISPNFAEDQLIYAYVTTPRDNRVVTFTLDGPVTPVLTGIPKGVTGNAGRLMFLPNGDLLVGTGDAGRPALAADRHSLAGKVLRVTDIGRPADGNPAAGPVYTSGHHAVMGLCFAEQNNTVFEVEATETGTGEINSLAAGGEYGWPSPGPDSTSPVALLPGSAAAPGGCTVRDSSIYVTSLDGKQLLSATLTGRGANYGPQHFRVALNGRYGRLRTVVTAPDGALWLTTSNKDGHGSPVPTDERVIRLPGGAVASNPA